MRFLAALLCALAMSLSLAQAEIFDGEELITVDGKTGLIRFYEGSRGRPLIVLAPGGGTAARIFYGVHDGRQPDDFLATHLNAFGYNVLAVSIPIDTGDPIFDDPDPGFSIRDWGTLLAGAANHVMRSHGLGPRVILAGWSMAGKSAQSMAAAARARGFEVELFISLAATPPVLGVLPIEQGYPMTPETGYGQAPDPDYKGARWNLRVNAKANGVDEIIPALDYLAHYVGEGPVGVSHTGIRYRDAEIVADMTADILDGQGFDFAGFPLVATVIPSTRHDIRHAVTDLHTWGMITTNHLYQARLKHAGDVLRDLSKSNFQELRRLIIDAPERLSVDVPGNHFFFVGEIGARQTAEAIASLEAEATVLVEELDAILNPSEASGPEHSANPVGAAPG
ncbi:MAG: hypothetical protein AAF557_27420 [Pseudomonadota bacterium]